MKMDLTRFKLCLALAMAAAMLAGCQTAASKPKGLIATLRLHLQVNSDRSDRSTQVPIDRSAPIMLNVDKAPFLTEENVANASVVDQVGVFALRIEFDSSGTKTLEQYSTAYRGRCCAIFSQFGEKDQSQARWLAAPVFTRTISDGVLIFTPDASREEAERIARGLVNLSRQIQKKTGW